MMDDEPKTTPIMADKPEDEEELRARRRALREDAGEDQALRAAASVGALGGNAGPAAGAIAGRGGALGIEEVMAEEAEGEPEANNRHQDTAEPGAKARMQDA
jgi:hypothetical protein